MDHLNVLWLVGVGAVLLIVAGRTYPYWIGRVFDEDDARPTPADTLADGRDYVKTPSAVVFAHHFASIAGAGPIVGPIIALSFGWGPAWLWIIIGGIFYGAVHDMSTMFVSLREGGRTIAEIARRTLGNGGYLLFVAFLLLVLSLVNAIFLKLSAAALTSAYPLDTLGADAARYLTVIDDGGVAKGRIGGIATTSVIVMTLFAPLLGWLVHRRGAGAAMIFPLAALVCIGGVLAGFALPVTLPTFVDVSLMGVDVGTVGPTDLWQVLLATYVFVACWLPVWIVLQPRDFMNVQILYGGIALLVIGLVVGGFGGDAMQMPVESIASASLPIWPMMFITIACGAISGFHSLVATGTTVKQIPKERDCRRIGYWAMLLESFLAVLVLAAVGSQMSGTMYAANMSGAQGGSAILTFAIGCGSVFAHLGIPKAIGCVLGILIIEGFLVTTLDTAVRLGRYLFEELWSCLFRGGVPRVMRSTPFNTACTVGMMLLFAYSGPAYDALWPYFGAGNQLIGALALTTVAVWLLQRKKTAWFVAIPAVLMVVTAVAALGMNTWTELQPILNGGGIGVMPHVIPAAGLLLLGLSVGFVLIATVRLWQAARGMTPRRDT